MVLNVFKCVCKCVWECVCCLSSTLPCQSKHKLALKRDMRDQTELKFSTRKYR